MIKVITDPNVLKQMSGANGVIIAFQDGCYALTLHNRGAGDPHVSFTLYAEDDGHWQSRCIRGSSYWLESVMILTSTADAWARANLDPDIYAPNNRQYGYKTKA